VSGKPDDWDSWWSTGSKTVIWNCNNTNLGQDGYEYVFVDGIMYAIKDYETIIVSANLSGDVVLPVRVEYNSSIHNITKVGDNAFSYCQNLTSLTMSSSTVLTELGYGVFSNCPNLTKVVISYGVTKVGTDLFKNSPNVSVVYCERECQPYDWNRSWNNANIPVIWKYDRYKVYDYEYVTYNRLNYAIKGKEAMLIGSPNASGTETIPSYIVYKNQSYTVTSIGTAFSNCSNVTKVIIPDTVTKICSYAFYSCDSLTEVIIPTSVVTIEAKAFSCKNLTICCRVKSKPSGWNSNWNYYSKSVLWGYTGS
jgi:hypothetical protein